MIVAIAAAAALGALAARAVCNSLDLAGRWVSDADGQLFFIRDLESAGEFEVRGVAVDGIPFAAVWRAGVLGSVRLGGMRGRRVGRRQIVWHSGERWYRQVVS